METVPDVLTRVQELLRPESYRKLHWEGTFEEYLQIFQQNPRVARSAFQRLYDMILSYGYEWIEDGKDQLIRYRFFYSPPFAPEDAVYGLERHLMQLVNIFKAAARGYGPERRVILLHGPVGSSKSTIVRLLKRGLEEYSKTDEGALYSFSWIPIEIDPDDWYRTPDSSVLHPCPINEEPLKLIPTEVRDVILEEVNRRLPDDQQIFVEGDLCPPCRFMYRELMRKYQGDWNRVIRHVRVRRLILSEKDRVGIGTFQPKDEKNQDSTELTGDINYRKIAIYGSDSDPRAFNFDGEFCVANRGLIEFIEVLKLDVAFLYDLLGASQEHLIKPKKFAQTYIDEVIIGHSVAGWTPIPYRFRGVPGWATIESLYERFARDPSGLEVLAWDDAGRVRWTRVRSIFRHRFSGDMLTTSQKWGVVETTPNHAIYDRDGHVFYPEDRHEILAVRRFDEPFVAESVRAIDVVAGIEGFVTHEVRLAVGGGPMTRPARPGWARLALPRHATEVRAIYDVVDDEDALKDLITVLVWYASEGHVNGRNGGIVITQSDRNELERVRAAYQRITTGSGFIDVGAKTDSAWRLYLGSQAIARLAVHHCGKYSHHKRLPDFLFWLPTTYLAHAFNELMKTDGSRRVPPRIASTASPAYRERYFEYKTISPMLAAQVGTLATLLGYDYSVYRHERPGRAPAYRIRFVSGDGKRGGRQRRFQARLLRRPTSAEWVYDIECEGLHNFVCGVGNVVCHNTNEPEYRKLQNNEYMEALRDRTIKVDIPYVLRLSDEIKIYQKYFNPERVRGKHIAPHTLEVAAMWAILTRLEEPKIYNITLMQKLKLYNGKMIPGFTADMVAELRKEARREGMFGISPRYVQDKISNALVADPTVTCVNPFMVMNEMEAGLDHHSLISSEDQRRYYRELMALVRSEYEEIIKNEVQQAIVADEEAINRLFLNYIDNVRAYTLGEKIRNKYTGQYEEPDERLMRSIEEKIDIPENRKDDFRRELMNYIGALAVSGKGFDYRSNERLYRALQLKLFEDQKDAIKLSSLVTSVVDKETQEKIDIIKARMKRNFGYCDICASDVLHYVASIFARGDIKQ